MAIPKAPPRHTTADNGGELVVAGLRTVVKLVLAPAWAVAVPASLLSRRLPRPGPWLAPLALALSALLWAWRRYGGTWSLRLSQEEANHVTGAVLGGALRDYLLGWIAALQWIAAWYQQAVAAAGLVPQGRLGEAVARVTSRVPALDGAPPLALGALVILMASLMWPVAVPVGFGLASWWAVTRKASATLPGTLLADQAAADAGAGIVGADGTWAATMVARLRHWQSRRRAVVHPKGRAIIGYLASSPLGQAVRLPLAALVRHLFLIGATGYGKTTLLLHLVDAALREGWAVVMIDCKGDPDLLTYAEEHGGDTYTLDGTRKWDALKGNRTNVADRLIAGEMAHSQATYYPEIMGRYVQTVLGVLDAKHGDVAGKARDPHEVARLLAPAALKAEVAALVKTGKHDALKSLLAAIDADYVGDQHTEQALLGFRHRFNRLLESVIGPTLGPGVGLDQSPALDLAQSVRAGRLVLFSVPTDAYQGQGKKVAMWAILAMQAFVAELRADYYARMGGRLLFVIDEFAQLEEETTRMGPLLRMARSAGVGVILAAQGTVDLFSKVDARTAKATLSTIMNACSTKIVMHLGDTEDKEVWVEHHGEREVEVRSARYDAAGEVSGQSASMKKRPNVSPDELGKLTIGQAIVETPAGLQRVLVPARLPVTAHQPAAGPSVAGAGAAVVEPASARAPMAPDPDAHAVINVEARTIDTSSGELVAAAVDDQTGAPPGAQAHRATSPRRKSRLSE